MGDLARSGRIRSLSPRPCRKASSLFEGTTTVPPCSWDEEYPKQQQLRRSMSDRRPRNSPTKFGASARRRATELKSSLWSAENREYLEMRFGLIQKSSQEAPKHGVDASPMEKDREHGSIAELKAELEKGHSPSASSDEASSIFSNPECSSFSSGSDVSSIGKEESSPAAAEIPAASSSSSHEQNEGFLEFDLVEGHLVAESAPGGECDDLVTARACKDELPAQDGISRGISPEKKTLGTGLRSSSRPLPYSSFAHDDRYPVWASKSNWHLLKSYKERTSKPIVENGEQRGNRCSERKQVARRLLRGCSPVSSPFTHHMFHMIPSSLFSPRIGPLRGSSSPMLPELFAPSPEPSDCGSPILGSTKIGDVFGKSGSDNGSSSSDTEQQQQQQQRLKHSGSRSALNSKLVSITRKRWQLVAEAPEIPCRPFLPVAAKKSCLPAAARRPLFSLRKKKCSSEATTGGEPSSSSSPVRQAHLHCVVRHDHHSYTFVVDGSDELLVARTGEGKGATCSFYSWKQQRRPKCRSWKTAWTSHREDSKPESELVGRMGLTKRFCNPKSNTDDGSFELEFVLQNGCPSKDEEQVLQMGSPSRLSFSSWETSWLRKSPCSSSSNSTKAFARDAEKSNPWWYVGQTTGSVSPARARQAWRKKSLSQNCSPSRGKIDDNVEVLRDLWGQMEAAELKKREEETDNSCSQSEELAAFVITVPAVKKKKKNWNGLGSEDDHDEQKRSNSMNVTVILPAGHHGLPSDGSGGPRPLIERWRSAGTCDCGSWDLGCALNILQRQKQEHSNLLEVSLQASSKQPEVLNLVALRNGLFSIRFKEPLSALQAFAAAVAILRSDGPAVAPLLEQDFMRAPLQALDSCSTAWSKTLGLPSANNGCITSNGSSLLPFERL